MFKKILLLAFCFFSICSISHANTFNKKAPKKSLQNNYWKLKSIYSETVPISTKEPYIFFNENGKISGCFGCNQFFGTYTFTKNKIFINYSGSTKIMCSDNKAEDLYSKAIKDEIKYFKIEDNSLTLLSAKKKVILSFEFKDKKDLKNPEQKL